MTAAVPYDVAGVSFPSTPGVILGHNRHIAWAPPLRADAEDLFRRSSRQVNPTRYEYRASSATLRPTARRSRSQAGETSPSTYVTVHGRV